MTYPSPKRNMVPKAVLMRSCLVSLTTAKPVNTAQLRTMVNSARPMTNVFNKAHSTVRRPTKNKTTTKNSNSNQRINTVRGNNVNTARPKAVFNAVKGNQVYAVNTSACNSTAERIWVKINAVRHNRLIPTIYISCMEHFWTTAKVKTVNGEVQLHGPSYDEEDHHYRVRLHNKNRVKGSQCPLILTTPTINSYHTTSQPQKTQKPRKPKRKNTKVPQPSGSTEYVADEAVNEEMDDSLVRAATTAFSLEAEQDSGVNTPRSDEDRLKLNELMEFCTKLQQRVLDLENTKTAQAQEITSLKLRVKKLEKKGGLDKGTTSDTLSHEAGKRHFKTLSLDELRSADFNLLSDQEYSEEEEAEAMTEIMEQYMSKTRTDYGSGVARPKIEQKDTASRWLKNKPTGSNQNLGNLKTKYFDKYCPPGQTAKKNREINIFYKSQIETFFKHRSALKALLMKCPQYNMTEIPEVILYYNGLLFQHDRFFSQEETIPTMTAADAKTAIQEMAEYSQKWHNGTSRGRSTKTS
ncbi:hypothetical protein Tco_0154342 [Tanacetum coccineum]